MSEQLTQDTQTNQRSTTTEYVVLHMQDDAWTTIGSFEVPVGRADKAKAEALKLLAANGGVSFTVVAVPAKSWQPETFRLTVPEPTFTKA